MIRKCLVCEKTWNKMTDRSFHRFPKEYFRRITWMEHLNITEGDLVKSKDALICSDHFELEDVYSNSIGQDFLKFNAVPKKLKLKEALSLNVLPNVECDVDTTSALLNKSKDIFEDEKKLFWNIKQEPFDLYPEENFSNSIEQHMNAGPNFEECDVLVKKELNSDDKNEHTEQHLKCTTIKKKRQRKLKELIKKANSFGGIFICEVCGNMFTKQVDFFCHIFTNHHFGGKKLYKTKINQRQISNIKNTINYNTPSADLNVVVKEEIEIIEHRFNKELQETDQLNNFNDVTPRSDENVISNHINTENCDTDKKTSFSHKSCFNIHLHKKDKPFICVICSKSFLHNSQFVIHMRFHTGEKPFKCDICLKSFRVKDTLSKHMRCHTGERPFKCEICLKSFRVKDTLSRHILCHTGERPYKCNVCTKSYTKAGYLNTHMLCHTGEKPYECEICLKAFREKGTLNNHMRCHTGEKPFECKICLKSFREKGTLTRHMRCHTGQKPFKCEICLKSFTVKGTLTRHMLCHTGEKPFKCEVCTKSFTQSHCLNAHLRCHNDEKPFECTVCLKSFKRNKTLNRHMRIHTGEKALLYEVCSKSVNDKRNLNKHTLS